MARVPAGKKRPRARAAAGKASHSVRLIGGLWKRTPIPVPDLPGLRPTPDRVRETLFNWLAHLRPDFSALRGLDAFAGTGALGFELASRGAARVTLVERAAPAVAQLRALKVKLDAAQVDVLGGDTLAVLPGLKAASFDVIFLDPPFDSGLGLPALAASRRLLAPGGLIYLESAGALPPDALAVWDIVRQARAGRVRALLLQLRIPARIPARIPE